MAERRSIATTIRATGAFRGLMFGFGVTLVIAGMAAAPLPAPFGLPLVVLGLILILRSSIWARRHYVRTGRRWPKLGSLANRVLRRHRGEATVRTVHGVQGK